MALRYAHLMSYLSTIILISSIDVEYDGCYIEGSPGLADYSNRYLLPWPGSEHLHYTVFNTRECTDLCLKTNHPFLAMNLHYHSGHSRWYLDCGCLHQEPGDSASNCPYNCTQPGDDAEFWCLDTTKHDDQTKAAIFRILPQGNFVDGARITSTIHQTPEYLTTYLVPISHSDTLLTMSDTLHTTDATDSEPARAHTSHGNTRIIIGISVAACLVVILFVSLVVFCCVSRRASAKARGTEVAYSRNMADTDCRPKNSYDNPVYGHI